jgi:hypothetical protein
MKGYELSRRWFDFAFEKKEAKVYHTALFMWCIELNNRLGWKEEFGLPTQDTMEGLGIGNRNTFRAALKDLDKWGFIKIVQESKNQFQACYISILSPKKCPVKSEQALDKALNRHRSGQSSGTASSSELIDKPINNETNKQGEMEEIEHVATYKQLDKMFAQGLDIEMSDMLKKALDDFLEYKFQRREEIKSVMVVEKILADMFSRSEKEEDWIWMFGFTISKNAKNVICDLSQKPTGGTKKTIQSKLKPEENKW